MKLYLLAGLLAVGSCAVNIGNLPAHPDGQTTESSVLTPIRANIGIAVQKHPYYRNVAGDASYLLARSQVANRSRASNKSAKNVILFVGDGMGVSTVTAARIYAGQLRGEPGEENYLSFERFPHVALSKTYNYDAQVPDSAGTISAMMSGVKTLHGVLGVTNKVRRNDCSSLADSRAPNFLELMEMSGRATGVISTAEITHATPGATYSHVASRGWANDASMPVEALEEGCQDIAQQLLNFSYGNGIEVVLGGGRRSFLPEGTSDFEDQEKSGNRRDGRNLISEWQSNNTGGAFVWNSQQFRHVSSTPVLGLFEYSHMKYNADRAEDAAGEPSLAEMTEKAIRLLSDSEQGFFIMIEAGRIDHGHHGANAFRALNDTVALSNAVAVADELTNDDETLIIVTADHSHTMTINGYPVRGNPILGKVRGDNGELALDDNNRPYTTLTYANGPGHSGQDISKIDTQDKNYRQEGTFPKRSETHGGEDVAVYAKGPSASLVGGVMEQNEIFHVMLRAVNGYHTN